MEDRNILKNSQIIILGVCIAAATVAASLILSKSMIQIKRLSTEVVSVKGSSERRITSDQIVWRFAYSRRDPIMQTAYQMADKDREIVHQYLLAQGIREAEITFDTLGSEILYKKNEKGNDTNTIEAYKYRQSIEIKSDRVAAVNEVAQKAGTLISQGVELEMTNPQYFYTKLPELKLEMLEEAAKNAKSRAEKMASATGNKVGFMRAARMGVFQITPVTSVDVSDWGQNDTSSLEKKVMAVVSADFSIIG